jgi:Leucine-rich repeat (LRR) protein
LHRALLKAILVLRNLTKLLLLNNELSGLIPPGIGNCTSLSQLWLNSNRLFGMIPTEVGNLKNLDMSENHLVGPVPWQFQGVPTSCSSTCIQRFVRTTAGHVAVQPAAHHVSENQLAELQHRSMPELTKLYLGKNWLSGGVPPELDSCDKLHLLDLVINAFIGVIPPKISAHFCRWRFH